MKNRNLLGSFALLLRSLKNPSQASLAKHGLASADEWQKCVKCEDGCDEQAASTKTVLLRRRSAGQSPSTTGANPSQASPAKQAGALMLSSLKRCIKSAFSLVEILIALIIVSVVMAALAPVITKKIKSSGVTISGGGGGGGGVPSAGTCGMGQYFDMDEQACKHCPEGHFCDGFNKLVCLAGTSTSRDGNDTHPLNGQSQCIECADGFYAPEASPTCIKNTAIGCGEYSKIDNACLTCANAEDLLVDGNCVKDVPVYTLLNSSGTDITAASTELTKGNTYWTLKIKASGTLSFSSLPANVVDVFTVGGGAGGTSTSTWCSAAAAGGGAYNIVNNLVLYTDIPYSITIGSGGAVRSNCIPNTGGTTKAFGIYTGGGVTTSNFNICPFNDASCDLKYGAKGSSSNQIANTGNGGNANAAGKSGIVIIRGKLGAQNAKAGTFPTYKFLNNAGSDITYSDVTLNVTNEYWFMKFASTGTVAFNSLPNKFIDVFTVGGGAGGTSTSTWCSAAASGGASYNIVNNVVINTDISYPITIGSGSSVVAACTPNKGGTTSAFGVYTHGGLTTSNHSICQFNDASCGYKHGVLGATNNQNYNTGNGGIADHSGRNGVVIIRGKRTIDESSPDLPVYKFLSTSGVDATAGYSTLSTSDSYWYLKFASNGNVQFDYLPNSFVDVFVVGGGAGGTSTSTWCSAANKGGGTYSISKDVNISTGATYPIVIGSGGSVAASCTAANGGTSSAFGVYSRGGLEAASYALCQFGDATCDFKYGASGSTNNQNHNTGNGGIANHVGHNGAAMIRGKRNATINVSDKLPVYSYTDSGGSNITYSGSTLNVTDTHWYIKFTKSGTLKFDSIKNSKIDVFAVGGGAGGTNTSTWCSAAASGGGNYKISTDIDVASGTGYSIVVGSGGGVVASCTPSGGAASSGFGVSAAGGSGTTAHSVCLFNGSDCSITYGNKGSDGNQFQNTGNGGAAAKSGMNGTVIIRGTL